MRGGISIVVVETAEVVRLFFTRATTCTTTTTTTTTYVNEDRASRAPWVCFLCVIYYYGFLPYTNAMFTKKIQ